MNQSIRYSSHSRYSWSPVSRRWAEHGDAIGFGQQGRLQTTRSPDVLEQQISVAEQFFGSGLAQQHLRLEALAHSQPDPRRNVRVERTFNGVAAGLLRRQDEMNPCGSRLGPPASDLYVD